MNSKLLITYTKAKLEWLVLPFRIVIVLVTALEKRGKNNNSMIPLFVSGFDEGFERISEK